MHEVIRDYQQKIEAERENSRKRRAKQASDDGGSVSNSTRKPARETLEQSFKNLDVESSDRHTSSKHDLSSSKRGGTHTQMTSKPSSTRSQLNKGHLGSDGRRPSEREVHLLMVRKVCQSVAQVMKTNSLSEEEKVQLVEQILLDLITPTFETMKELEEKLHAATIHAKLKQSLMNDQEVPAQEGRVTQAKLNTALEMRVQELSREKSDLEMQLIECKKELQQAREAHQPTLSLKDDSKVPAHSMTQVHPIRPVK